MSLSTIKSAATGLCQTVADLIFPGSQSPPQSAKIQQIRAESNGVLQVRRTLKNSLKTVTKSAKLRWTLAHHGGLSSLLITLPWSATLYHGTPQSTTNLANCSGFWRIFLRARQTCRNLPDSAVRRNFVDCGRFLWTTAYFLSLPKFSEIRQKIKSIGHSRVWRSPSDSSGQWWSPPKTEIGPKFR